jgi:hypothetical protein
MSLSELSVQVDHQYQVWIKVSRHALADGRVDCGEARKWLTWYKERKKELDLLKREIRLEINSIRGVFKVRIASTPLGYKTDVRNEQTLALAPFEDLLRKIERLSIEGERLKPTLERYVESECETVES